MTATDSSGKRDTSLALGNWQHRLVLLLVAAATAAVAVPHHILVATAIAAATAPGLIQPADLTYLGAFRIEERWQANYATMEYSNAPIAFYPGGDPANTDAFPGSLFIGGHTYEENVKEVRIPAPVNSKTLSALPIATQIQSFRDIDAISDSVTSFIMGMTYVPSQGQFYYTQSGDYQDTQGDCQLPGIPGALGSFGLGLAKTGGLSYLNVNGQRQHPYHTLRYIMEIPPSWSSQLGGRFLATGRHRGWCPEGSNLYASAPASLPAGGDVPAVKLLEFGDFAGDSPYPWPASYRYPKEHSLANAYQGAAWLTAGANSSVIISGIIDYQPARSYYGYANWTYPNQCEPTGTCPPGGRGWRAAEPHPTLLFYNPQDLVDVANGVKQPWEPQWYAKLDLAPYMLRNYAPTFLTTGSDAEDILVTFDRSNGLLYISESFVESGKPVVHVFRVAGLGAAAPSVTLTAAPASITAGQSTSLSWTSTNATSLSINQGIGSITPFAASGSRTVSPTVNTTYTITATNSAGSVTATATATVNAPTTTPHTAARANSYDDAWQTGATGWVENAKTILASATGQVPGMVIWIGDSLTRATAMGAWAQSGAGKTAGDQAITTWMHAGASPQSVDSIDGFALAAPYICSARSYTVGDGRGSWHFMDNAGMPNDTNPTTARQKLADCTSYPNDLSLVTILSAIQTPQFAIPEVNLDSANPGSFPQFEQMVDLLISKGVVPIIITYTYRENNAAFNAMVDQYNTALVNYARTKKLPLIDFNHEMLERLPLSQWPGRFLADGTHYTTGNATYPATASPYIDGGDPATHTTGLALTFNGYGLKGWLGVQKMKEIKSLVIDTMAPPPTVTLTASPATVSPTQSSRLTWTVSNATSLSISPTVGVITPVQNGSRDVTPTATTTYTITATNAVGSATANATVTYTAPSPGPTVDLNGDGVSDSLPYNPTTGAWSMVLSDGTTVATGTWPTGLVLSAVDLNGNRSSDVFGYNAASGTWMKALNTGSGFQSTTGNWWPGWTPYVLNLDGNGVEGVFLAKGMGRMVPLETAVPGEPDQRPWLSSDGLRLYFSSTRASGTTREDLFVATRTGATAAFSTPVMIGGLGSGANRVSPSLTADELTIVFASSSSMSGFDLWMATRASRSDPFSPPVLLSGLNSALDETNPEMSPDGRTLYFESDRLSGEGGFDVWMAVRASASGSFGAPVNFGALNTTWNEGSPVLRTNGSELFFESNRPGGSSAANTWRVTLNCDSVTPATYSVGSSGGTPLFSIAGTSGCSWVAASPDSWIGVGNQSATGNGTVTVTVAANSGAARSGSVSLGGRTLLVSQSAPTAAPPTGGGGGGGGSGGGGTPPPEPTPGPAPTPSQWAPQNVQVQVIGTTVLISWLRPLIEEPLEYILEAGSSPGASNLGNIRAPRGQTAMSFANIPFGRYYARIRAVFASGAREASAEQVINVGACASMPPTPDGFTSQVTGGIVRLTWSLPTTAPEPSAFVIEAGSAIGLANLAILNLGPGMRSLTVGAPPGRYYVRLKGRNACGDGPVSNEIVIDVR